MTENKTAKSRSFIIYALLLIFIVLLIAPRETLKEPSILGKVLAQVRIRTGAIAPTFDYNLTNRTINQSGTFILDVNCSDVEFGDIITYYDNFTAFDINSSTGLINQTGFNESFVGNNTINITCSDGTSSTSQTFVLTIINTNLAPVLGSVGNQVATVGVQFTLDVDATDPDNDNLTFAASTSLFTINPISGLINFTPSVAQVGNYTINISVFDGELYDYEIITFTIVRGPFCGDNSCASDESCSTCSSDCGNCIAPPSGGPASGGGAGGNAGGVQPALGPARAPYYRCDEKWECSEWGVCSIDGIRIRKCMDINNCITKQKKPVEIEKCEYVPTCIDGILNGNEEETDCGGDCEPCIVANCFDGLQNSNETGVDCGGSCKPCEIKKFPKVPFIELPATIRIPKQFPWLLVLFIAALILLTVTTDQTYVRRIRKKKFEDYRESIRKYRILRRRIYKGVISIAIVTLTASFYIFIFSNDVGSMIKYSWVPASIILLVPIVVSSIIRRLTFYEYKKRMEEERLKETHKREILQMVSIENKLLIDLEGKAKKTIYNAAAGHKFDGYPDLYKEINPAYGDLSILEKKRRGRVETAKIDAKVFGRIYEMLENKTLLKAAKDYEEFMSIIKNLEYIEDNINLDTYDEEKSLMQDIEEISKPHMISVIKSSKGLVHLYNDLVDVYEYLKDKHEQLELKDKEIQNVERTFTDKIKGMAKKAIIMEQVQKESDFASIYNSLIDLFNHYMKKQELSNRIKS